jgi:hypothetical protein
MGLPMPKVAHWMCEGSGKAYDFSGGGNDLELKNQAHWEGKKIVGDDLDDYGIAPCDLYNTGQYTNFTWTFSYKCTSINGNNRGIAALANALNDASVFCGVQRNVTDLKFIANGDYRLTLSTFLSVGKEYIITVTNNAGNWCFYVDGILKGTYGTGQGSQDHAISCYINNAYNGYAGGEYKYNYVFPETFNSTQVQTLYNNPFGMFEPIRSPQWIVPAAATTAAPTTLAPTSLAPTSLAPTSLAPTTAAPTLAPTTVAPADIRSAQVLAQVEWVEFVPTTAAPTTPSPTTGAPTTAAPTTLAPTTAAPPPTTLAPTTAAPTTSAPTTAAPTLAPTTVAPTTQAPTTPSPTTAAPTPVPTTLAPTTLAPTTPTLTTVAPTTGVPEEICVRNLNSTIIEEISLKSVITKETTFNGYLC